MQNSGQHGDASDAMTPCCGTKREFYVVRFRALLWLTAVVALPAASGCSWFPLVDYSTPLALSVEEPAKVVDLTI